MKETLDRFKAAFTVVACLIALLSPINARTQSDTTVNGGGTAILTDDTGLTYPMQFALAGVVRADGSAAGHVNFVFPEEFSEPWGAVPGVNRIHIAGRVTSGEMASDGTIILEGTLTERDYASGQGVVFLEEDVPFRIEVGGSLGPGSLHLQWCLLPVFRVDVSNGNLRIQ